MTGSTLEDQESHQNGKIWLCNAFRWLTGSPHLKITRIWGEKCDVKVYTSTVRRRLLARGLKGCRAQSKPLLTTLIDVCGPVSMPSGPTNSGPRSSPVTRAIST
uniref:Uncharacterized protein n=1 Tax=Micrurus spixii TaxID=129469 RepID=A0A2D4LWT8_9SAUR